MHRFIVHLAFDESSMFSLKLLAAHVYWKCLDILPSMVRSWWGFLKNRQLSLAVEEYILSLLNDHLSFTQKFYSPRLSTHQLSAVSTADRSLFEGITVKRVLSEIVATYEIEEAKLGLLIKLPSTYPLRQVEISEAPHSNRAGVAEKRWKAWLLSVAAVMIGQNGSIVEAIQVFHKNVSSHYTGVEDCAICYSVIGAIDRTLPQKRCGTCKNLFHSSCLFKVFSNHRLIKKTLVVQNI